MIGHVELSLISGIRSLSHTLTTESQLAVEVCLVHEELEGSRDIESLTTILLF